VTHGYPSQASAVSDYRLAGERYIQLGDLVSQWFTYDRNGGRFYSICKQCKAARVRAAREQWRNRESVASSTATPNPNRRFGVELEVISPVSHAHLQSELQAAGLTNWRVRYDGSLSGGGAEIVSPILSGDDGHEQVKTACRVLRRNHCTVNRSCGMHVHHEIRDMTIEAVKKLTRLWSDNQDMIDGLVAPSRRRGLNSYCGRLTTDDVARVQRCTALDRLSHTMHTRYKTFNLAAYGRYGTVEIRQHQGTIDAEKVNSWIKFGQALIEQSRCATIFQATTMREMVGELAHLEDTAGTFLLGRAVRFNAVAL
jgi:hypothetical protein